MISFLKKTLLFLLIPLLTIIIILLALNIINNKTATSKGLNTSCTTVFLGDSHIEQCINDTLLQNCVNLAQNSESFYFSYFKLKLILENNQSVKNVYLGFSYHSISSYYDKFIDGEFSNAISSRYFFLLPIKEKISILTANRHDLFSYLKVVIKNGVKNILSKRKTYQGGFVNSFSSTKANAESIAKRVDFQYYQDDKLNDFSSKNIEYLIKIIDLCKESNVHLTLINTPVDQRYKNKIPQKFKGKFEYLSKNLKTQVIDLSDLLSDENYFIPDGDHVSQKGAFLTTGYISKDLN